tara:strand:- start:73 stop:1041 length:969 start_codon:yes stop_codon:yes gene_type:complete
MRKFLLLLFFISVTYLAKGQGIQFSFTKSLCLSEKPFGQLHGISGIDYNASTKEWHWVNDRGVYFLIKNIESIEDFQMQQDSLIGKSTIYWFESIRIDPTTGRFIFSVENEFTPHWQNHQTSTYVSYFDKSPPKSTKLKYIIPPMDLPADNSGIEAIALTNQGKLWVAPERGWKGETVSKKVLFKRYKFHNDGYLSDGEFHYEIEKEICPNTPMKDSEGISEILAITEDKLLVLERCYDNVSTRPKIVKAKLWEATISGNKLIKSATPAFDFNASLPFIPDNLEAMAWWPNETGKRQLLLVTDDNPGTVNRQKTQLILLTEQ